jgi:hypothetical protein
MTAAQTPPSDSVLRMDADALTEFFASVFPAAARAGFGDVVSVVPRLVRMVLHPTAAMIRPGTSSPARRRWRSWMSRPMP